MPDLETRGALPAGPQIRAYPAQFEVRGLPGSRVELRGYASTYDQPYDMYDMFGAYTEVARQGMCAKTLGEGADVAYLANHEGLTLARTKSRTLVLTEDATGLETLATLNTARGDARDLVTAVEDGDVDEMSFSFRITRQEWSPDYEQRDLVEVNLNKGDVSAVNYGANPATHLEVAQRAFRSRQGAELHRMAAEVKAGTVTRATADALARALEGFADARDRPEAPAASVLPVAVHPGYYDVLRMQLAHQRGSFATGTALTRAVAMPDSACSCCESGNCCPCCPACSPGAVCAAGSDG